MRTRLNKFVDPINKFSTGARPHFGPVAKIDGL